MIPSRMEFHERMSSVMCYLFSDANATTKCALNMAANLAQYIPATIGNDNKHTEKGAWRR